MKQINKILTISALAALSVSTAARAEELLDSTKVHVAFRTVEEMNLMGGVSVVDMEKLIEKDYSTYSLSNMSSLVSGYDGFLWVQGSPLVLVDGVPRDANNVLPTEIAQITFMKSAQAVVLYGSRGANGVILITTKRGVESGLEVSVRANAQLFVPKSYPNYLGSAEYATLYNEALRNDGLDPAFSQTDIYNYAAGTNPFRYPNTNFFSDEYLKKNYMRYDATAEFRGGGKFARYYANVGLYHNDDLINFGEGKKNGTTRLNVRGNIDLRLNDWISGWVNTSATFYDVRGDRSNYWAESATLRPTNPGSDPLVPLIPISAIAASDKASWTYINNSSHVVGGKYLLGGTQQYATNPFAAMYAAGHNTFTSRQFQFDLGVDINLARLLEGLSFRAQYAVDYATTYNTSIINDYATYRATWDNALGYDMISSLTKYNLDKSTATQTVSGSSSRQTITFNAAFNYNRTFDDVHNVSAMLLANGFRITNSGEYHRTANANLGLDLSYNYANKYYAQFSGAMVHSSKLAPGHRNAFSPTGSLAWRLSEEEWLKDSSWLNDLKLTASYGLINQDISLDYYMWDDIFTSTGTWWGWSETNNSMQTTDSKRGGNPDLGFVKRKEFNAGVNATMFDGLLRVNASFFNIDVNDQPTIASSTYPNYFMSYWPVSDLRPYINYNNQRHTGFDFGVNVDKKIDRVNLNVGVNGMYVNAKNTRINETVEYDWLRQTGANANAMRGYQCLGFVTEDDDLATLPKINNDTRPGDLKYVDQNGDGVIDSKDQVVIGKWGSPFSMGVNLTLSWNNFTLFAAGSGVFGGNGLKCDNQYYEVYGDRKYSEVVRDRWTSETAATATYPRLTTGNGDLNFCASDFWLYSTDAFYLNKVQLTYNLPSSLFRDKFVKGLQVYVSGDGLATIAKERKLLELNVGSAPQTRCYTLGAKIDF